MNKLNNIQKRAIKALADFNYFYGTMIGLILGTVALKIHEFVFLAVLILTGFLGLLALKRSRKAWSKVKQ